MPDLTQKDIDSLNAEELACFLDKGCVLPADKDPFNNLTEEQLDEYMREMKSFDL